MLDDGKLYAQQPDGLGSALSTSVSGTSLVAECARTKEVVHTKDAYYTEGFNQQVDQLTGYRTKSVLCIPLLQKVAPGTMKKIHGVVQFVNKFGGEYSIEDMECGRAFAAFLTARVFSEDLRKTDFKAMRGEFSKWCTQYRRQFYENRVYYQTVDSFREDAALLLKCDKVELFLPNREDNKKGSVLRRSPGEGTVIVRNRKLATMIDVALKQNKPSIENNSSVLKEMQIGHVFDEDISSLIFVPFSQRDIKEGDFFEIVAVASHRGGAAFDNGDRDILSRFGSQFGKYLYSLSNSVENSLRRRRKARAWTLQQRVRFKPQGKTAGRRNSATARNPERSRSLLDTHLNTFRRNLERNVSMADEADAIEVAKDLPDLRVVMANFVSFVDGSDKKRRSSLNGTALINAISEAASDMSVALYAAKLVKDRMVKAERMLRIEQRKSTTLKVAVDELAKKPKTQNVRLDTEDLNVWSDQRTKVRRLFFRTKRIKIRQAFQHWLQRLGMKFYATYFEAKKNRKMQQLFIRRSQRVKSYGLQRMKLYVINHQRSSAIVSMKQNQSRRLAKRNFYFKWKIITSTRMKERKVVHIMMRNCRTGLMSSAFHKWNCESRFQRVIFRVTNAWKKRKLHYGFSTLLWKGHRHRHRRSTMQKNFNALGRRYKRLAWRSWRRFYMKRGRKFHADRAMAYFQRQTLRKRFVSWKNAVYLILHNANHSDIGKAVAALNTVRLFAWRRRFMLQRAWNTLRHLQQDQNYFHRVRRKCQTLKTNSFFIMWRKKLFFRKAVRMQIKWKEWGIVRIRLRNWRRKVARRKRLQTKIKSITRGCFKRNCLRSFQSWKRHVLLLKKIGYFWESRERFLVRKLLGRWSRYSSTVAKEHFRVQQAKNLIEKFKQRKVLQGWHNAVKAELFKQTSVRKIIFKFRHKNLQVAIQKWAKQGRVLKRFAALILQKDRQVVYKYFHKMSNSAVRIRERKKAICRLLHRWRKIQKVDALRKLQYMNHWCKHYHRLRKKQDVLVLVRFQMKVFIAWKKEAHIQSIVKKLFAKERRRYLGFLFDEWHYFAHLTYRRRLIGGRILRSMYRHALQSCVKMWHLRARHLTRVLEVKRKLTIAWNLRTKYNSFQSWADHAHKIKHERKIVNNIVFRISHRSLAGHFYTWVDHARHRVLQRRQMNVAFKILAKNYCRIGINLWTHRHERIVRAHNYLFRFAKRWKLRNERLAFNDWHLEAQRMRNIRFVAHAGLSWKKRSHLRLTLQKWQLSVRAMVLYDHKQWMRNTVKKNCKQAADQSMRQEGKKNMFRCFTMWLAMVKRRRTLRKLLLTVALRKRVSDLKWAVFEWTNRLWTCDKIKEFFVSVKNKQKAKDKAVTFRSWRSTAWQCTMLNQRELFAETRKEIEKKVMKMPLAWSIMKWQMFAASVSYKELCRAQVRAIRTENRQLQSALVDYHRRGLFLLSGEEKKGKAVKKTKAPRDAYILQGKANYSLTYASGEDMLAATYREEL